MTVETGVADGPAGGMVTVTAYTPQGVTVLYLDPDTAEGVGRSIFRIARSARTGLVLPDGELGV
jgi:hypothetical protein